jgi:CRISPR-associated protein Cas1
VAEVFKPIIVDRMILALINRRIIKTKHFESRLEGVLLNEKGRKRFVEELDNRLKIIIKHPRLKRDASYGIRYAVAILFLESTAPGV